MGCGVEELVWFEGAVVMWRVGLFDLVVWFEASYVVRSVEVAITVVD